MKTLWLLLLLCPSLCIAASLSYITNTGSYSTSTTCEASSAVTPSAGDDIVEFVVTFTSGVTFSSVASTVSAAVTQDYPFVINSTNNIGFGAFRVHNTSSASQNIIVTFSAATECYAWLYDMRSSGSYGAEYDQVTAVANGTVSPFTTNSLLPAASGALLIAIAGLPTSKTLSSWTNSFTQGVGTRTTGPTAYSAYLAQTTAASTNAGATVSASGAWSGLLIDYIPAGAPFVPAPVYSNGEPLLSKGSFVN